MGKGKRFELQVKNAINEHTDEMVKAHRPDYSGSSRGEVADIMVVYHYKYNSQYYNGVDYFELKKRSDVESGYRTIVMDGSSNDENGRDELLSLITEVPPWTSSHVCIKFPRRELLCVHAQTLYQYLTGDAECDPPNMFGARFTESGNISMRMPTLDEWDSATAGEPDWKRVVIQTEINENNLVTETNDS